MADRTSAAIFGDIFLLLAENPIDEHKELARKIYEMSVRYDFMGLQMGADDACMVLGVMRMGIDSAYPDDGWTSLWLGDDGFEEASDIVGVARLVESHPPRKWAARALLRDLEVRRRALEYQEEYGDPVDALVKLLDDIVGDTAEDRKAWEALVDEPY